LFKNPQKRGRFVRQTITTPRKPNSAIRKIGKVVLSNKKRVAIKLPGSGYYPNKFATILIRGKGYKDTPGVKYTVVRGALECIPLLGRMHRRSLYGVKKGDKILIEVIKKMKEVSND
jgi:small subunit ribosomal protein S12